MEAHWVLERTELGHTEIATRQMRLSLNLRAVLIMVDGKSDLTQLHRKMAGMTAAQDILSQLLNDGLIRRRRFTADPEEELAIAHTQAAKAHSANLLDRVSKPLRGYLSQPDTRQQMAKKVCEKLPAAPAIPAPSDNSTEVLTAPKKRRSLALARLYLLDQMERSFGAHSEVARTMLRTATTQQALEEAFKICKEVLLEVGGEARALAVEKEFLDTLPETTTAT